MDRLQAVKEYLELTFSNETELEDLVFLASEICDTPIASITLVDDKKQYPVVGFGDVIESSCDIAFCNTTIKRSSILEVPDALADPRFANNPLVTGDPYIRFYAGIPLINTDCLTMGSLCVIDKKPKKLSANQVKSLEILAKQTMRRLEVGRNIQLLKDNIKAVEESKELLEQAELMKRAFYDGCEDFFILLNPAMEIVSFNSSAADFFSKNNDKVEKGRKLHDYLQPVNRQVVHEVVAAALEGKSANFEILVNADTDIQSWNEFTVSPTYNSRNELIGVACIGCNIDEDKKLRKKIETQKNTLSQIARLHSHEIRHPLTNILSIIDLVKQENFEMTPKFIEYLEAASKDLDAVIRRVVLDSYHAS